MRVVYVRCPSCNKVLSNKEYIYQNMIKAGIPAKQALDELELEVCCRIRMLGHTDVSNDILEQKYYNFINPLNPPPKLDVHNFPELNSVATAHNNTTYLDTNQQREDNDRGFVGGLFADDDDIKII